jgi:peptidoglycan/LPS O-acetylase OafA/YrhL
MSRTTKYYQSVDLLRGITAMLVAIYHFINYDDANGVLYHKANEMRSSTSILPGVVFVFFLLSGFVISMTMQRHNFKINKIGGFLARRWIRIELPYVASIIIYLFIAYVWASKSGNKFTIDVPQFMHHLTYTANFFNYSWYNDVYWTLALEFQFYLLIAILFPLFSSKLSLIKYTTITILSLLGVLFPENELVFRYAPIFVLGMLMFSWLDSDKKNNLDLLFMSFALIQVAIVFDTITSIYLLASLVVIDLPISGSNLFAIFGKQSYSFYLLHGAFGGSLMYFLVPTAYSQISKLLVVLSALVVSVVLSYVFFKLIETPSHRLSRKIAFSNKP